LLQDNITKHKYQSVDHFEADVMLLCQNTHTYNVEGSQVIILCDQPDCNCLYTHTLYIMLYKDIEYAYCVCMFVCQSICAYQLMLSCPQIYNDATQLVQVFRHYRAQLDTSELDQSDNEGSLHSALQDVSPHRKVPSFVVCGNLFISKKC